MKRKKRDRKYQPGDRLNVFELVGEIVDGRKFFYLHDHLVNRSWLNHMSLRTLRRLCMRGQIRAARKVVRDDR